MAIEIRSEPLGSSAWRKDLILDRIGSSTRDPRTARTTSGSDESEVVLRGVFLVAYDGEVPIGCSAFRVVEAEIAEAFGGAKTAEIKWMWLRQRRREVAASGGRCSRRSRRPRARSA